MSSFSLLLKKNFFPLISLALVIVAFTALNLAAPIPTNSKAAIKNNNNRAAAASVVASRSTPKKSTKKKADPSKPSSIHSAFSVAAVSARISRSNLTIEEWVRTKSIQPDVDALAISFALIPDLIGELNASVPRYSFLFPWDVAELPSDRSSSWDLLMGFLRDYPQLCDAFTNTSAYVRTPPCLQRYHLEPRQKHIDDRTPWMCRTTPFAPACTASIALIGTGLKHQSVEMWERRMFQFGNYVTDVAIKQTSRMVATEEASSYWYVFCLKSNAADDLGLRKCLDNVVRFRGIIQ
ncbi:hypothetical protein TYRP_021078 [Tyrophagus putrescentiae]|nr:hypothetical protein TYRP_021078 [Tyrophagus putrescentiae]